MHPLCECVIVTCDSIGIPTSWMFACILRRPSAIIIATNYWFGYIDNRSSALHVGHGNWFIATTAALKCCCIWTRVTTSEATRNGTSACRSHSSILSATPSSWCRRISCCQREMCGCEVARGSNHFTFEDSAIKWIVHAYLWAFDEHHTLGDCVSEAKKNERCETSLAKTVVLFARWRRSEEIQTEM